jgi:hypothetical protein
MENIDFEFNPEYFLYPVNGEKLIRKITPKQSHKPLNNEIIKILHTKTVYRYDLIVKTTEKKIIIKLPTTQMENINFDKMEYYITRC